MKLRKQVLANIICIAALAGNSLGVMAQDKTQTQGQSSGKVIVRTPDGQTKELTVEGNAVFVDEKGQQVRVTRSAEAGTVKSATISATGAPGTFFFSQDGSTHNLQGQDFIFVQGQSEPGQVATFSFVSSEMSFDNKLVKGAPFAADVENETVQTLFDGNRIVRKSGGAIYRDTEGRTRRESTINAVGPFAGADAARTITINDPVAGTIYSLEPQSRIARKIGFFRTAMPALKATTMPEVAAGKKINISGGVLQGNAVKKVQPTYPAIAKAAKAAGAVQVQIIVSEEGKVTDATVTSGHPLLRDAALEAARQWEFKPVELSGSPVKVQGTLTFNFTLAGDENKSAGQEGSQNQLMSKVRMPRFNTNEESLGKQMIEGVEAEGKRSTTIIPAGAIGNERPIEIVSESWYSPELQTVIMSKRTDPTTGETSFRLTNIRRGDPDTSLFQVPSDYTVKEGGGMVERVNTFNLRVPKPDNQ